MNILWPVEKSKTVSEITIKTLGRKADGIATDKGQDVFVPFTLEGEVVQVEGKGPRRELVEVIKPSPDRIEPICPHFGICGGCQLQHMGDEAYMKWKLDLAMEPLKKIDITCDADPMITFQNGSRRKVVLNAINEQDGIVLGFAQKSSNELISLEACPVTSPAIIEQLGNIKDLIAGLPLNKTPSRISVLETNNGLDVQINMNNEPNDAQRQRLIQKTIEYKFVRISVNDEVILETQKPEIDINGVKVCPPPGSFVQAIKQAEDVMSDLVCGHLKGCKKTVDLFSGIGTFALGLAQNSTVFAVESSQPALDSLERAWRDTGGKLKQVTMEARNLEIRPVNFAELKRMNGLVFDPPRAGAQMQAQQIAKSKVSKVAAVSCNPTTLARDLEILIKGGYQVTRIVPIDQFRYTPHIEMVVLLERG